MAINPAQDLVHSDDLELARVEAVELCLIFVEHLLFNIDDLMGEASGKDLVAILAQNVLR